MTDRSAKFVVGPIYPRFLVDFLVRLDFPSATFAETQTLVAESARSSRERVPLGVKT